MDRKQEQFLLNALKDEKHNLLEWMKKSERMIGFEMPDILERIDFSLVRVIYLNWCLDNKSMKLNAKRLADHFGKDHKFIDRYSHFGNSLQTDVSKGTENDWFKIMDYLMVMDNEKPREYTEYVISEEDLELYGINIYECEYRTVDGERTLFHVDDGWEEEEPYDDYYENLINEEFTREVNANVDMVCNALEAYSPAVRKMIVNNFGIFWYMTKEELNFIEYIHCLKPDEKKSFMENLERVPVSKEMVKANGRVRIGDIPIYAFLIDEGMSNTYSMVFRKWKSYEGLLRCYQENEDICLNREEPIGEELKDEIEDKIGNILNDRFVSRYDVENHVEMPWLQDTEAYQNILDKALSFTEEDWYALYLLCRVQVKDFVDVTKDANYHKIMENYYIRDNEYNVWKSLSNLSGKDIEG